MKTKILTFAMFIMVLNFTIFAQNKDSIKILMDTVVVDYSKTSINLKLKSEPITLIQSDDLENISNGIGAEEAIRNIPGITIDNQHNSKRVHISIRGQGILTENGIRSIGIFLDDIPMNDPTGFVPDLYDVDWDNIGFLEVMRGSTAGLYATGAAGGVIYLSTKNTKKPFSLSLKQYAGSFDFYKSFVNISGNKDNLNYSFSFSKFYSKNYRIHQAYEGYQFYQKLNYKLSEKFSVKQIISYTYYFQQNPEGLNYEQLLTDPRLANPDAIPFNEYQLTRRTTLGLVFNYKPNSFNSAKLITYLKPWFFKETSNKAAEYANHLEGGVNLHLNNYLTKNKKIKVSYGLDYKAQTIGVIKHKSAILPEDLQGKFSPINAEEDTVLANETIFEKSLGAYGILNLKFGRFFINSGVRYDILNNSLLDDNELENKNFVFLTPKIGASIDLEPFVAFVNYSYGNVPPNTEELAHNPFSYSGFNSYLIPAKAQTFEFGLRFLKKHFYAEITPFYMTTENDFFRFKLENRGNQEVFYFNAGATDRKGVEFYVNFEFNKIKFKGSYTYSDFKYASYQELTAIDTLNVGIPQVGQWLPNISKHKFFAEVDLKINRYISLYLSSVGRSKWAIYTNPIAYDELDPIYHNWQQGYWLLNGGLNTSFRLKKSKLEVKISSNNILDKKYVAYTEPDFDGNSYHPGPGRQFFVSLALNF